MELIIHVNFKLLDRDEKKAFEEYQKRLRPFCQLTLKNKKEGEIPSFTNRSTRYYLIPGEGSLTSNALAEKIKSLNLSGISCIEFVIDYNNPDIPKADATLLPFSLSSFTLSSGISTVVLSEQLYRAYTILNHITYHK